MKHSSAVIQISKNLSNETLEAMFVDLCDIVEDEYWVIVEEGFTENSYWIPTPLDEIEEDEFLGAIEISAEAEPLMKIIALAHEVGHLILHLENDLRKDLHQIFEEAVAWYLGYNFFRDRGYIIDIEEYKKDAKESLEKYIRSFNEESE
jgi:hypothetical protein